MIFAYTLKKKTSFSPTVFLAPMSMCIKKLSNLISFKQQKIFWVLVFSFLYLVSVDPTDRSFQISNLDITAEIWIDQSLLISYHTLANLNLISYVLGISLIWTCQILNFDFFFHLLLPVENNNKYSKFDISKSLSYQGQYFAFCYFPRF